MIDKFLQAGARLAEALEAENKALTDLSMTEATRLAKEKVTAADAFAAAHAVMLRHGPGLDEESREPLRELAERLGALGEENKVLLERAISLQGRVIRTIAGAALPLVDAGLTNYTPAGRNAERRGAPTIAVSTKV